MTSHPLHGLAAWLMMHRLNWHFLAYVAAMAMLLSLVLL
jgi:hypothetical protein